MQITFPCAGCQAPISSVPAAQGTSVACSRCGLQQFVPFVSGAPAGAVMTPPGSNSRQMYILLGILLGLFLGGGFGIHNFVVGRTTPAILQLVLCLVGLLLIFCTFGLSSLINVGVFVWVIVEACTVTVDGRGQRLT